MSHLKEFKSDVAAPDGRALGDEWADWDGEGGGTIREGRRLFIGFAGAVLVVANILVCLLIYMMVPRMDSWSPWFARAAWLTAGHFVGLTAILFVALVLTVAAKRNFFPSKRGAPLLFNLVFSGVFRLAELVGISRDRIGHSFVHVSNAISRARRPRGRNEKLLILLPRCLAKEELQEINSLKGRYPLEIHTVSGGELARKKVRELKPTAVIGVACERDLVSGIRDVGQKISVIGIPNERPEGPCRNTRIDLKELVEAIEFYVQPI